MEAAVEGNVTKMKWALLAHPLVREYELVEKLVPHGVLVTDRDAAARVLDVLENC